MSESIQKDSNSDKKNEIVKVYADLSHKFKRQVKMNDLVDSGVTKDMVTHHFGSLTRLNEEARVAYPSLFYDVSIDSIIGPKALSELQGAVANCKRFIISTAVTGCQAGVAELSAIKNWRIRNNGTFLVLAVSDPAHNRCFGTKYGSIDKKILDDGGLLVLTDTALNSNLYISTIKLSAKQIDATMGLTRIGQRNGSFIYASPKQRMRSVPVSNVKIPRIIMTTGAITKPNYSTDNYMSERTAYIAENDHVMGAVIVEIQDNNIYYFRQVQMAEDGSFIDLGVKYLPDGTTEEVSSHFIPGDLHIGSTDPVVKKCWKEVIKELRVKTLIMHDIFDGISINHHEMNDIIIRAQHAAVKKLNLSSELKTVSKELDKWADLVEKVVVVKSNHDEFLEKYLKECMYVKDPHNHRIALELSIAMFEKTDPLKYGLEKMGLRNTNKIKWLKRDEDFKISRIQLGNHGDKGANGAKGSVITMENAYGNCVTGHSHTPEILRGAWVMGTSSFLKLAYNKGPSSWMQTGCILYENGSRQLINVINGKWRLEDNI